MFVLKNQSSASPTLEINYFDSTSTLGLGAVVFSEVNLGNNKLVSKNGDDNLNSYTLEGVSQTLISTAGTSIATYTPIVTGQLWIADCTSDTNENQLQKNHQLTNAATLANTSTSVNTSLGIFHAIHLVGATTDRKLAGYFIKGGATT